MGLAQTSAPSVEPLTLTQVKAHLRVVSSDEHDYIDALIAAARQLVEDYTGRQLINATWAWKVRTFPVGRIVELPKPPLSSVTSIGYTDDNGDAQTISADDYNVYTDDDNCGRIELGQTASWPTTYGDLEDITYTYVAGYGASGTSVPGPLMHAMKLLIAHWYENREAVTANTNFSQTPLAFQRLVSPYKVSWA